MAAQGGGGGGAAVAVPVLAGTPVNRDAIKRQVETDMIYGMVKYAQGQRLITELHDVQLYIGSDQ